MWSGDQPGRDGALGEQATYRSAVRDADVRCVADVCPVKVSEALQERRMPCV